MIIRTPRKSHFSIISNDLINDPNLDWRDIGLLVYLLSKPDNWNVNPSALAKEKSTGIKGIYASLTVLQHAGYVCKKPNPKGGWDWDVYDSKLDSMPNAEKRNAEKRNAEIRHTEDNQHIHSESVANRCELDSMPNAEKRHTAKHAELPKNGMPKKGTLINTEYITNTEDRLTNTDIGKVSSRFIKPTMEELADYFLEIGSCVDINQFFDYYEANGWMVGKSKMKDWKAAARNWVRRSQGSIKKNTKNEKRTFDEIKSENRISAFQNFLIPEIGIDYEQRAICKDIV